jgi:hypothetical protein
VLSIDLKETQGVQDVWSGDPMEVSVANLLMVFGYWEEKKMKMND